MHKFLPYTILFLLMMALQAFVFDNLMISPWLNPLVYIAFIVLLPFETSSLIALGLALVCGISADWVMGIAGINTIATLLIAFVRHRFMIMVCGREAELNVGMPSCEKIGYSKFFLYISTLIVLHHLVFFAFESLPTSWEFAPRVISRVVVSSAVTILMTWLVMLIFTPNQTKRA